MDDERHVNPERPRRLSRARLWIAFLTFCAVLGLGKPVLDLHWENQQTLWRDAVQRERATRWLVWDDINTRLRWVRNEDAREAERIMGLPNGYLGIVPAEGRVTVPVLGEHVGPSREDSDHAGGTFIEFPMRASAAGWNIDLHFRDGRVVAGKAVAPRPTAAEPRAWLHNTATAVVRGTLFVAPLVWLGGLLAGMLERTRGTRFGEIALAGAIAGTLAWAVRPGAIVTQSGWVGLGLGGVMVVAAVWMIRWLRRIERSRRLHFCYDCGYDLTGNTSGVCPECGHVTPDGVMWRKAEQAEAIAHAVAEAAVDEAELGDGEEVDADAVLVETEPAVTVEAAGRA